MPLSQTPATGSAGDSSEAGTALALACLLNLASCALKLGRNSDAVHQCSEALALQPGNRKALYRRGQACRLAPSVWARQQCSINACSLLAVSGQPSAVCARTGQHRSREFCASPAGNIQQMLC